jgi:hypothetical protein
LKRNLDRIPESGLWLKCCWKLCLFNQETKEYFVQPLLYALVLCKEITPDSSIKAIATARASYCQSCYNQIKGGTGLDDYCFTAIKVIGKEFGFSDQLKEIVASVAVQLPSSLNKKARRVDMAHALFDTRV